MLYDFRVKSSATQETKSIVAETEEDGPGELYMYPDDRCSFSAASASFVIPLNESNTVTIIPQLEEDDDADLNNSTTHNDPNDLFCTTIGPFFNFTVKNRTLAFGTIDGQNASNAHFSMNAGTTTAKEDDIPLQIGGGTTSFGRRVEFFGPASRFHVLLRRE